MEKVRYSSGLPKPIKIKISKTSQTRGAENDEIYQNRVSRNSTVIIPFDCWNNGLIMPQNGFENGYIVLISPEDYFSKKPPKPITKLPKNLKIGENLLVFYQTRDEWNKYNPNQYQWEFAKSRKSPLGGQYVARIPDTTRSQDSQIWYGYTNDKTGGKGAGIRVYEYASSEEIESTKLQLAFLVWRTEGIIELCHSFNCVNPEIAKNLLEAECQQKGLINLDKLQEIRAINHQKKAVCPLCLEPLQASDFISRIQQAEGRNVPDLTVTSLNLFHIKEVRTGEYNHRIYNLAWGHHHCNTVVRDMGIEKTLNWMQEVVKRNS